MKTNYSNRFLSIVRQLIAGQAIIISSFGIANATTYYWDTDSTIAGFGTAGGTWGTDAFWNDSATGGAGTFVSATATADILNFGNGTTGLVAGTITVGNVSSGNITFASGSGSILLSGGTITLAATETITANNTADSISSILAGAGTSLTKAGTGTLTLSGANTYTGATNITNGKLNIQHNTALGGTVSGTTVTSGASLQLQNDITVTGETLNIAGNATTTVFGLHHISGNNTWAGTINVNTATSLARIASDAGTLTLSGSVVTSGTSAGGLVLQGVGNGLVSGIISGNGELTRSSVGAGTWTLSGANTYTGLTTVSNILNVQNNSALGTTTLGTTVASTGSLQLQGGITVTGEALTLTSSSALVGLVNVSGNNEWAGTIGGNISGNNIRLGSTAGTLTVSGNVTLTSASAGSSLVLTGEGNGVVSGNISVGATSTTSLIKSAGGTWTLTGANTYLGSTRIDGGALSVASLNSVSGGSASSNLGAPTTVAAGTIGLAGLNNTLTPGTLVYTGNGEITDRVISLNGLTAGGTIHANNASGLLKFTSAMTTGNTIATQDSRKTLTLAGTGTGEFAGAIVNSTLGIAGQLATSVTKTGSGIWTLSGANTYTGDTTVTEGILAVSGSSIADTNKLVINGGKVQITGTEIVNSLYFGTVQQLNGTWGSTASDATHKDNTRFSGTEVLNVTTGPLVGFASWITGFSLAVADQDPTDDPDGDGLNNLLEYTLSGVPNLNDGASIAPTGSNDGLGNYIFTFQRSDLSETDTTQSVEYGNDLAFGGSYTIGASPGTAPVVIQEDVPSPTIDTVTVTIPTLGAPKFFARLKVVK